MRVVSKIFPPIVAVIMAMIAINSADVIHRWWEGTGPAIEWRGVEVITTTVQPGGQLEMIYTAVVHRQCPADLRGFIIAPDGTVPVRFPIVSGGYAMPSDEPIRIRVSIAIPHRSDLGLAALKTGPHIYRTMATRYCPAGAETDVAIPDVPFHLEVR